MAEAEDRTEAPTAQRLAKAREDGQIPLSKEATSFAALVAGTLALFTLLPVLGPHFYRQMRGTMETAATISGSGVQFQQVTHSAFQAGMEIAVALASVILAFGIGAGVLQSGFLVHPGSLLPKFSRVSPMAGFKRLFGGGTLPDTIKSVAKFCVFSVIAWHTALTILPQSPGMIGLGPAALLAMMRTLCLHAATGFVIAQLVIAGADVLWTRYRHTSRLKMSRQDLKDEHRNSEGDPHVKGRLKALRAKASRARMMSAVEEATVVVTNPTHYAVALKYEKGAGGAPRIVAKGVDDIAARIREIAQDHRVPIVPNPPLARALYTLPLDSEVPLEHFKVVAGVIAYVWKLKRPAHQEPPVR